MEIFDNTPIRDVALMLDMRTPDQCANSTWSPPAHHVDLGYDLEFTPVHDALYRAIRELCEPFGEDVELRIDLTDCIYGFVRNNAPGEALYHWDPDSRLGLCIALSRLIHPTSLSYRYGVRIIGDPLDPDRRKIIRGPTSGPGGRAWTSLPDRDWLDSSMIDELRALIGAFFGDADKPARVRRAFWYHEYASRTLEVDVRWTFVATALEALLNTDSRNATEQFIQRVRQLAERLGGPSLSRTAANDMYRYRSKLAMGSISIRRAKPCETAISKWRGCSEARSGGASRIRSLPVCFLPMKQSSLHYP